MLDAISFESVAAGYASGCAGLLVGHPLDSLKVMLQSSSHSSPPSKVAAAATNLTAGGCQSRVIPHLHLQSPASMQRRYLLTSDLARCAARRSRRSAFRAATAADVAAAPPTGAQPSAASTTNATTLRALYRGIQAPLVTVGAVQSLNFALYDAIRRRLHRINGREGDYRASVHLSDASVASFLSGGAVSAVTGPLVSIKIRQQVTGWGLREALLNSVRTTGGMKNLYRGYSVHFVCDAAGRAIFFPCYEALKREISLGGARWEGGSSSSSGSVPTLPERMAAAAISGVIALTVVYPFDAIRTHINGRAALGTQCGVVTSGRSSIRQAIEEMWAKQGVRAFVRGYGVAAARSGPVSAVAMPVYDMTFDCLHKLGK
mmetsp:Transcript_39028/g.79575  ORF Transcript_39028/g.79575 Transcript_39028/m.79575 type:complete len:375 (-) Transcript_39028:160-1284(-)